MSAALVPLADFPLPNYLTEGTTGYSAHLRAMGPVAGPAHDLKLLASAIYAQAARCGPGGSEDYTRAYIVDALLRSFVELLNYERGGWDGGTCDSWARAVGEYIGQPLA